MKNWKVCDVRLGQKQKEHLIELISAGLRTKEINEQAKKFRPSYQVTRQQVDFYRKRLGVKLDELDGAAEAGALKRGFALRERRVESLNTLAEKMEEELIGENMLWLDQVKMVGSGRHAKQLNYEEFNAPMVQQFRGVLDDIAKEAGDRRQKVDVKVDPREALAKLLGVPPEELPAAESDHAQP